MEIEDLRNQFTDASMMHDWDRFASLFTEDGAWRMPHINEDIVSRAEIRAKVERLRGTWEYFVQSVHQGTVELHGDTANGRSYVSEFGRFRDGRSNLNYSLYHDRYQRTPDGWKFKERVYEVKYVDNTPLAGSTPGAVNHAANTEAA
jgi:ketosteroid isomerase-like protein